MNVTIHQPRYLPYLGLFAKISNADIFIIYDTAQYEKGLHNRQQIRTAQGATWLTIPLKTSLTSFRETPISYDNQNHPWYEKHWRAIELNYKKTPFFRDYQESLFRLYHENHPHTLADFNIPIIQFLLDAFVMRQKVVLFSELGIDMTLSPSAKLAAAVQKVGGGHYVAGPSSKNYLELDPFTERRITVDFFSFEHPRYPQYHSKFDGQFLPNMAVIDALFNIGHLPFSPALSRRAQESPV